MDKEETPLPVKKWGGAGRGQSGPTKFNPEVVARFCELIGRGVPQGYAAPLCGVSVQTIANWKAKYAPFREDCEKALARGVDHRLQIIADNAASDWRCAAWWLERVLPQFFSRQRIEIEAVGQLDHAFVIPKETLDAIAEARARLDKPNGAQPLLPAKVENEDNGTGGESEAEGF
jgi:hypothetical protein